MADISLKRLRDDEKNSGEEDDLKRFKSSDPSSSSSSYNDILSFLEEDEEEPNQDLSSLITSLQQEISSTSEPGSKPAPEPGFSTEPNTNPNPNDLTNLTGLDSFESSPAAFEDEVRHLLEASDDELGIPNIVDEENGFNGGGNFEFSLCDGLWEFEDATANYYTLFQSELFM